ncbi:MAG: ATP-binding protein [Chloroflexota bacterium]
MLNIDTTTNNDDVCQICGGLGIVGVDVPVGHPDFGKAFPCVCQADKIKSRKTIKLRNLSNLEAFADKTFATFQIDHALLNENDTYLRQLCADISGANGLTEAQRRIVITAVERAAHYAESPDGWLLFQGTYGTGKTHLGAAIANRRLEQNQPVLFITVPDLLDHLRSTYGPSSEVAYDERFDQLRTAPLLILDDLGAESPTAWAQEKLFQLLSYRHTRRLPTVITTNSTPEVLEPRIRSRVLDQGLTQIIVLTIPDQRSPVSTWQDLDLSNLDRYRSMTFETFDLRQDEGLTADQVRRLDRTVQMARYFAESPRGWLVLTGEPGCGKTHLAAAMAFECKQRGDRVLFVTASDLLDHLRVTFYPGSSVSYDKRLTEIRDATVLVLDNLNIDKNLSSWARDKLFDILIYRFDYNLPTVLTTIQPLGEMEARLKSRVSNKAHSVVEAITVPYYPGRKTVRRAAQPRVNQR